MDSMYLSVTFQSIDFTQKPFAVIKNFLIERETKKKRLRVLLLLPSPLFPRKYRPFHFLLL